LPASHLVQSKADTQAKHPMGDKFRHDIDCRTFISGFFVLKAKHY
jgi:hypothetical protein